MNTTGFLYICIAVVLEYTIDVQQQRNDSLYKICFVVVLFQKLQKQTAQITRHKRDVGNCNCPAGMCVPPCPQHACVAACCKLVPVSARVNRSVFPVDMCAVDSRTVMGIQVQVLWPFARCRNEPDTFWQFVIWNCFAMLISWYKSHTVRSEATVTAKLSTDCG